MSATTVSFDNDPTSSCPYQTGLNAVIYFPLMQQLYGRKRYFSAVMGVIVNMLQDIEQTTQLIRTAGKMGPMLGSKYNF